MFGHSSRLPYKRVKPAPFGLMKRRFLMAVSASTGSRWPDGTLEAAALSHLTSGERKVGELVHDMLESDSSSPARIAPALVGSSPAPAMAQVVDPARAPRLELPALVCS